MVLQGLNYIAPILVWPYLMAVLGAEQFGRISFAIAANQYLMMIVDFGFNFSATKKIAIAQGNQQSINQIFSETLAAKLLLLPISLLILLVIAFIPQFALYRELLFVLFGMVVSSVFTYNWLFQGLGKIRIISIVNCVTKLSILPLTFFFVKSESDTLTAAAIIGSTYMMTAVLSVALTARMHLATFTATTLKRIKSAIGDSMPVFVSIAATSIYTALFVVILAYFASPDEVGKYTAAEKLMRISCYLIWVPLSQAFFPKISQLSQTDPHAAKRLTRRLYSVLCVFMLGVAAILFFYTEPLVMLLGESYAGIGDIAKILAFVPLFVTLGGVAAQLGLLAQGGETEKREYRNIYIIAAAIAIVGIFLLVPIWKAVGAAVAVLIVEIWVFAGMNYRYKKPKAK